MQSKTHYKGTPIGRKVEKVRNLMGLTQQQIADELGISKQSYSKLEQKDLIEPERLNQIAKVLGVTVEGLNNLNEDNVLICNQYISDTATFTNSQVAVQMSEFTVNNPIDKIVELYERLLKNERETVEQLLSQIKEKQ